MWLSHSPHAKTGYGTPTALWLPKLQEMGHTVACAAFHGPAKDYRGIKVFNADDGRYGASQGPEIARYWGADLVITLLDIWAQGAGSLDSLDIPVINWIPVDCDPLSEMDRTYFSSSKGIPVAMSVFGGRMLHKAGFEGLGVPYAYDDTTFYPDLGDRIATRDRLGLNGKAVIGINASAMERKAWPEQLVAFGRYRRDNPDAVLMANIAPGTVDTRAIVSRLEIPEESIRVTSGLTDAELASWYRSLDVFCACPLAEGFCLPVVEAQACGAPAIVTDTPPLSSETGAAGIHVPCEPVWAQMHQAWWHRPSVEGIRHAFIQSLPQSQYRREMAVEHAKNYTPDAIAPQWAEIIDYVTRSSE